MVAEVDSRRALRLRIEGTVQGVGFRPFLYRLASELGLSGSISNEATGVVVDLEGCSGALEEFRARLRSEAPLRSRITGVHASPTLPTGRSDLDIRPSVRAGRGMPFDGEGLPLVADLAPCQECLLEMDDPSNRRFRYPFIACAQCGPRYSVLLDLPYERGFTSFRDFPPCDDCLREYGNPLDRRFHAQAISCPRCGPRLTFTDRAGKELAQAEHALPAAVRELARGGIIAVKGVGGYQLLASAENSEAIRALRERKRRPSKPFALLARDLSQAAEFCRIDDDEAEALLSPERPIVLLERTGRGNVCAEVAPGNRRLGFLLPASPLHHLLSSLCPFVLVATSGNISGEPLATEDDEARANLGQVADFFLAHNRRIVRALDDSVVFFTNRMPFGGAADAGNRRPSERPSRTPVVVRRARGFAPLPVGTTPRRSPGSGDGVEPAVLALGAQIKNTVALRSRARTFVSAHIGDLDDVRTQDAFRAATLEIQKLSATVPDAVACDLHPDYRSTREALRLGRELGVPVFGVAHHHAHAAALLSEFSGEGAERPRVVAAWDGSGLGTDGSLWGGEFLRIDPTTGNATRLAALLPFPLPGGEAAYQDVRRAAVGLLFALGRGYDSTLPEANRATPMVIETREWKVWSSMCSGASVPRTTAVGRLFDGVCALLGLAAQVSFEGEAALLLQNAAEAGDDAGTYPLPLVAGAEVLGATTAVHSRAQLLGPRRLDAAERERASRTTEPFYYLDWRPMLENILAEQDSGIPRERIARRFHNTLARALLDSAAALGESEPGLVGGCFQNGLLVGLVEEGARMRAGGVLLPRQLPPGDGGLAVGQAAVVARHLALEKN